MGITSYELQIAILFVTFCRCRYSSMPLPNSFKFSASVIWTQNNRQFETAVITGTSFESCAIKKEMKKSEMKKYHNPCTAWWL
jgi:hypothetical protein